MLVLSGEAVMRFFQSAARGRLSPTVFRHFKRSQNAVVRCEKRRYIPGRVDIPPCALDVVGRLGACNLHRPVVDHPPPPLTTKLL
ncbi:hypothetical protein D3C71_1943990 [compost metagenome]